MSRHSVQPSLVPKAVAALILTLCSGIVDIIGYLGIFHLFTAQMTGTTVDLAHGLVSGNRSRATLAAVIVAAFYLGSVLGRIIIEIGGRIGLSKIASVTLAIEVALVTGVAYAATTIWKLTTPNPAPSAAVGICVAALAAAMGLQTATLTGIGPLTVHTTFLTGMINKLAQLTSHLIFETYDAAHDPALRTKRKRNLARAIFLATIWTCYLAGAASGVWLFSRWALRALYVSSTLLLAVIAIDQLWPLSIQEEIEQSER
ncbi:MAG: YoaK family protein [Candidatus Acidiferrales bacterium]